MQGVLVLLLAQVCAVASCTSTPPVDGSGGTGTGGAASGGGPGTGGAGTGGGGPAAGGTGGTPECDGVFDPEASECGQCQLTLEQFCADLYCGMPDDLSCNDGLPFTRIYRGCGYVERTVHGDVGSPPGSSTHVWLEATGELVYRSSTPDRRDVCVITTRAGERPDCDDWELSCDGLGGGGAGGMGGGP